MPTTPFNTFVSGSPAASALNGSELLEVVQGGVSSQTTISALKSSVVSVYATVAASVNDYAPTGYVAGVTNRLILTPAGGGSTITGLLASGTPDNWSIFVYNPSTVDSLTFSNLSGSSSAADRFACSQGLDAFVPPQTGAMLKYVVNQWVVT